MQSPAIGQPYRPDIDGLRAIAVLSVVAFHAFPHLLRGGFIGVDVFFVISGFLITRIILDDLNAGHLSFGKFYARRIRRIFPALIVVLLATYFLGWFILFFDEFQRLGLHVAAGAGFISNLALWRESGYFDASADTKPLLHLWSLGVEEQFYIIFPLLLWLGWRLNIKLWIVIGFLIFVSFFINIHEIKASPAASFYAPYARFWELMAGGFLAAIYPRLSRFHRPCLSNAISMVGVLLLVYGLLRIHGGLSFPGKWALVPVLAAVLLIAAGPQSWFGKHVLSSRALVWIGLISFPVYLWHWPLLTYVRILSSGSPDVWARFVAVALSFLLGWMTFLAIERPLRFGPGGKAKVTLLSISMIVVALMGWYTYRSNGFPWRQVNQINTKQQGSPAARLQEGSEIRLKTECGISDIRLKEHFSQCVMDERGPVKYALMGDSKASALFPGLVRESTERGRWMFIGGFHPKHGAPLPLLESDPQESRFINWVAIDAIAKNKNIEAIALVVAIRNLFDLSPYADGTVNTYDPDYLSRMAGKNYSASTLEGMDRAIKMLVRAGKKVLIVVDNPPFPSFQDCIGRKSSLDILNTHLATPNRACRVSLRKFNVSIEPYLKLLSALKEKNPGVLEIFDPTAIYCDTQENICSYEKSGNFLYADTDHISNYAASLVGEAVNELLNDNMAENPERHD